MKNIIKISFTVFVLTLIIMFSSASTASASHSWGPYHWARTANPFTLKLGDNVSSAWDAYLGTTSSNWTLSSVLDTTIVPGLGGRNCQANPGRVEVCNRKYGSNGWLGLAQIWINGSHITQALTKLNDTYFNTSTYNTPAWRRLVMCQEIAHDFGLDHQDEIFNNVNLGSCMDYTNDPNGGSGGAVNNDPSNEYPNSHDYVQLETMYAHLDVINTVSQIIAAKNQGEEVSDLRSSWGKAIKQDKLKRDSLFERDLGYGNKVFTHVFWAE